MKKVITYGTFDLFHHGHLALLKRAKKLGDYLIVGVTSDSFDRERGKLNVQQSVVERIENIKKTGLADEIVVEEYEGQKVKDIINKKVDTFAIGSDWKGKFDYLKQYCKVVYLQRTKGVSSTQLRKNQNLVVKLGIVGTNERSNRFLHESYFVSGIQVIGAYDENRDSLNQFCKSNNIFKFNSLHELLKNVDAVYIMSSLNSHFEYVVKALKENCHVICESPLCLTVSESKRAFEIAKKQKLVLFEAIKTLWFPAFRHLLLLISSGVIGTVKDISVTCTQISDSEHLSGDNKYQGSLYDWSSIVLLPIIKVLGTDFKKCFIYDFEENGFSKYAHGLLLFKNGVGTFKAGRGIKSEGELIITGTAGYIFVPSPWWKMEYFEVRYEDLRATKKYFYKSIGEGIRYEILEFVDMINNNILTSPEYSFKEISSSISVLEKFDNGDVDYI